APAREPRGGPDRWQDGRPDRARLLAARGLARGRHGGETPLDGREGDRPAAVSGRGWQDEPGTGGCGRRPARGQPVHALRRCPEGPAPELHRGGAAGHRRSPLRAVRPAPPRACPRSGRDRRVRRHDGGGAGERRTRHPDPRAVSVQATGLPEERAAEEAAGRGARERVPPPLVLASGSPRRAQLLTMLGLTFDVVRPDIDETWREGEPPALHVERLAREKAQAVAASRPDALVIACDTIVVLDGDVLGKPRDAEDAVHMLMRLRGRDHRVETGIAVAAPGQRLESSAEGALVRFRHFDRVTAEEYVATGEPLDKAGAYGIQGLGAALV